MDALELLTLRAELHDDCKVLTQAAEKARDYFESGSPRELGSCAYELNRAYNVIEQMALRIASAFENSIAEKSGWHHELIRRLSLHIPGIRPALFPENLQAELARLRAFRHVVRHAYDLELDREQMAATVGAAKIVAARMEGLCEDLVESVAKANDFDLPPAG